MSRLSRSLASTLREISGKQRWYHNLYDNIMVYWEYSTINRFYYNCKAFRQNLVTFIKLAWVWRPWDSGYTISVLVVLLKRHAVCLKNGHCVQSNQLYKRCMTAAGYLDKAYNKEADKTLEYLFDKNPWYGVKRDIGYEMKTTYNTEKRIYEGMYKVAHERSEKAEKEAKEYAWRYLSKYIEQFWD